MKDAISQSELKAAREGNEAALASIIAREMPLIRRFARRAVRPGLEFEDAVQEGIIGLFRAIETYAPGRGAGFDTYASVCIQRAILSAQRSASRKKHAPLNQSVPIPEEQSIPGPEDTAIANEQMSQTLQKARTQLSSLEKEVLALYLDGFSYDEIAKKLGKSQKTVDNALLRVRRKLR